MSVPDKKETHLLRKLFLTERHISLDNFFYLVINVLQRFFFRDKSVKCMCFVTQLRPGMIENMLSC